MGAWGLCEVRLDSAPVTLLPLDAIDLDDLRIKAQIALLARAHGAARRAFELAVDYAKERHQFGQPIGKFQAVQHKLANCLIALEGVRLVLDHTARLHDSGDRDWRYFADCAVASVVARCGACRSRPSIVRDHRLCRRARGRATFQARAPRHDRAQRSGSGATAAGFDLLDHGGAPLPQFDLGPASNELREQVRRSFDRSGRETGRPDSTTAVLGGANSTPTSRAISVKTGWIGLGSAKEFGGRRVSTGTDRVHGDDGAGRGAADRHVDPGQRPDDVRHTGAAAKVSAEILLGEAMHGMGYGEPQAGSDLAALRTSAVQDDDHWVINGQEIWTTTWWAGACFSQPGPSGRQAAAHQHQHVHRPDECARHTDPASEHHV